MFAFVHPRECAFTFVRGNSHCAVDFFSRGCESTLGFYNSGDNGSCSGMGRANLAPTFARGNSMCFRRTGLILRYGGVCTRDLGTRDVASRRDISG